MRRFFGVLLVAGIIGVSGLTAIGGFEDKSGPGVISPTNSKIEWTGSKVGGKHNGGFKAFSGKLEPATGDLTASKISVNIETSSIYSDVGKLTNHLKSPDFFGVDTYPTSTFETSKIEAAAEGTNTHKLTGTLTLHGAKKEISFPAKIVETPEKVNLSSTFTINRKDYGMNYRGVNDDVTIKLNVEIPRK